jgi:choline dehydrogenase-like flavoprotein
MIDLRDTADFAVVCAGSAGVVVASRLAGARVVLLYVPDETREFGMPGDTRAKEFLRSWYGRRGYRVVRVRSVDAYPQLAPLLATPCDLPLKIAGQTVTSEPPWGVEPQTYALRVRFRGWQHLAVVGETGG